MSASQGEESPGDGAGDGGNGPEAPEPPGGEVKFVLCAFNPNLLKSSKCFPP